MKIYTQENDIKLVQSVASASTLISSVTGEIKEHIASKFPRGFFKSVYIDTAETIHAEARNRKHNENLNKIKFPNIAITPEISLDDPIGGMEKSMHMSSPNLYLRKDMRRNYKNLVEDPESKFSIYYTSDYITTNFNFKITTNKFVQNIDLAYYIKSRFQIGMFQYLNDRYLNTEIPKTYIRIIASILGLDLNNQEEMDDLRLYLISTGTSEDLIRKKINAFTGKPGFFVNDKANFLINVIDLDAPPSIVRDRMSEGEYTITFRVQVSTWLPNAFIMSIDQSKFFSLDADIIKMAIDDTNQEQDEGFYSLSIPNFKLNRDKAVYFETSTGQQVIGEEIFHNIFTYNIDMDLEEIDIMQYLKADLKKIHAYMIEKNFDIRDLLNVRVNNRYGLLGEDKVTIDYETMTIQLLTDDAQDIAVTVYADRLLFASLEKAIENDQFFFSDSSLAVLRLNEYIDTNDDGIDDTAQEIKVPIYAFTNEKDLYSVASKVNGEWRSNVLRVYTAYGIGFIGLVQEDDPRASTYKVVIDIDENEQPIIRALEKLNI
jgi:hypothetical protein